MEAIDEIVAEFLVESYENLDQLDQDLLALEQSPSSRDLLASVFRTIHTIKGTSGFLAFHRLEKITHVGENLLSRLRDGHIALTDKRSNALLSMVDTIRALLASIEQNGTEVEGDDSELLSLLSSLREDGPAAGTPSTATATEAGTKAEAEPESEPESEAEPEFESEFEPEPEPELEAEPEPEPELEAEFEPEAEASMESESEPVPSPAPEVEFSSTSLTEGTKPEAGASESVAPHPPAPRAPMGEALVNDAARSQPVSESEAADGRRSVVESSVRIDVELLDSLMRMVGELVLARNQLVSRLDDEDNSSSGSSLARSAQRLSLVTSELQEQVMKTRMQPVDAVWSKMPRVVRDLARNCGRRVRLEMEGKDTELDRSVLEAIKDPLIHLVRNAVDHGIESSEDRKAAGKPTEGVVRLRAYHEAGQVHLEISDDGAGIDPDQVATKAVERGLVDKAQIATMSPREIINLIFLPGFSMAKQVTNVSGRGVGMDVVKTRIEGIGGSVDVISTLGVGSTFRLTIPLTLAIIPALTIGCGGKRYAVPQVSVLELVRLSGEHARGGIELISGAPVYRLRDMLLPLVRLDEQLGLIPAENDPDQDEHGGFIAVLHAEQQRFGLVVDDVLDTQEIVVKPLGRHLKGIPVYAGATILGDGTVVLILDAATLARRSNVLTTGSGTTAEEVKGEVAVQDPVLVVEVASERRAAIPLKMVTRLEEIEVSAIEHVGGREVVQYRGHIMPMVRLANLLGAYPDPQAEGKVQLVVYTMGGRSVGFVVDRILDIATERVDTRSDIDDQALVGSVVVDDKVVELLDVQAAVLAADPNFYTDAGDVHQAAGYEEVYA